MVQMGDEGHNRNRAGTLMFLREVLPAMIDSGFPTADVAEAVRFVSGNDHFFLNLVMPACKLQTRGRAPASPGRRVVTVMARNGTDFGIQTSGTGDTWFTAPANTPEGLFLGAYGPDDANPDIGDSAITETAGIGGFVDGDRAGDRPVRRRLGAGRAGHHAADVRHHRRGEPRLRASRSWSSAGRPTGIDVTAVVRSGRAAADQHRDGRPGRRHRPGRRRAGHAADGVLHRRRSTRSRPSAHRG